MIQINAAQQYSVLLVSCLTVGAWSVMVDKDRIAGSAKVLKGTVKEAIGEVTGDAKLETEGKADKAAGKVQNAIGSVKDAVRDALKKK